MKIYNPNRDIENTMIAQILNAPKESPKSFITNKVYLIFVDSLYTSITCTLNCVSISGFGYKVIGKIELTLGLVLITYASYLMLDFTINPAHDPHGFVLMAALFGAGIGGLMCFAGTVFIFKKKYGFLAQILLIVYILISWYTFNFAYA